MSQKRPLNTRRKLNRIRTLERDETKSADKADARDARRRDREGRKVDAALKGVSDMLRKERP